MHGAQQVTYRVYWTAVGCHGWQVLGVKVVSLQGGLARDLRRRHVNLEPSSLNACIQTLYLYCLSPELCLWLAWLGPCRAQAA